MINNISVVRDASSRTFFSENGYAFVVEDDTGSDTYLNDTIYRDTSKVSLKEISGDKEFKSVSTLSYGLIPHTVVVNDVDNNEIQNFPSFRFVITRDHRIYYNDEVNNNSKKDCENLIEMFTKSRSEAFGDEVKRRIMLGTYVLSSGYYDAYYKKAQQMRRVVTEDFLRAFSQVDALISPTCPNTAFDIGSKVDDPLAMYLTDIGTITANLAGIPAMSIPAGFDSEGMPIGLQIMSPQLSESKLFNIAYKFEQAHDYYRQFANI